MYSSEMGTNASLDSFIANTFGKIKNSNLLTCKSNVDRLKAGPHNIGKVLQAGKTFTDETFEGGSMIQASGDGATKTSDKMTTLRKLADLNAYSKIKIERWHKIPKYKDYTIFGGDGTPHFNDVKQGSVGNCYFISSISGLAKYPEYIKNSFVNKLANKEGIYGIRFFIRGKPWVITIDDQFLMNMYSKVSSVTKKRNEVHMNELVFAKGKDFKMWGPLLEKAWSKVKGTYDTSIAGLMSAATKAMTGAPVWDRTLIKTETDAQILELFKELQEADKKKWVVQISTYGNDDTVKNSYGLAKGHAYALLQSFVMKMEDGST